jgi:hypothetical protein
MRGYIALESFIAVFIVFLLSTIFYSQIVTLNKNMQQLSQTLEFYRHAKEGREILLATGKKSLNHKGVTTMIEYGKDDEVISIHSFKGKLVLEEKLK